MRLPNGLLSDLHEALLDAFPTIADLDAMLLYRMQIRRPVIADGGMGEIVFKVIIYCQARDITTDLLIAARNSNSTNLKLFEVARRAELAQQNFVREDGANDFLPVNARTLERTVNKKNPEIDVVVWRNNCAKVEGHICKIEYMNAGSPVTGTGFLVAPDVVLTNYHVMEDVIKGNVAPANVRLRFDYKLLSDGTTINSGLIVKLAAGNNWLIDSSPYSRIDTLIETGGIVPETNELDYALLLLENDIGARPLGENAAPGDPLRGYIKMSDKAIDFPANMPLIILQHPDGKPLKMMLDTESVIEINSNHTRVRYRTNTESGSSGSPCFNIGWELVALHHSGDPNYEPLHKPTYNQGIPIDVVYALIKQRGKDSYLGN